MTKDHGRAVVFCTGPSSREVDPAWLIDYPGIVMAVCWAVRIGHQIGADYAFFQDGAWLLTEADCACIVSGRTQPVIGMRRNIRVLTRHGKTYTIGDRATLPGCLWGATLYQLAGKPDIGGFQVQPGRLPGFNSGFSAINLVLHMGATRIALLGFDCSRAEDAYWPGRRDTNRDHESRSAWRKWINNLAIRQVGQIWGAEIVNGTPASHCAAWPKMTAREAIQWTLRD